MSLYQKTQRDDIVKQGDSFIPADEENADYQRYLRWLAVGNVPDEAAEEVVPAGKPGDLEQQVAELYRLVDANSKSLVLLSAASHASPVSLVTPLAKE